MRTPSATNPSSLSARMRTRSTTNPSSQSTRSNAPAQSNPSRFHLTKLSAAPGDPVGTNTFHSNECVMRSISGCSSAAHHLFSCGHLFCASCIVGGLRSQTSCKPKRSLRQNGDYKNSSRTHRLTENSLSSAMAKRKLKCFCKHTRQSLRIAAQWRRRSKIAFCRGLLSSEVVLGWQGCGQKESPRLKECVMRCFSSKR